METYHKIQTLFKRHQDGPKKGKMIRGDWTTTELEYLAKNQWEWTEKMDGTNIRVGFTVEGNPIFKGRTDNANIPEPLQRALHDIFSKPGIFDVFDSPENVTLFGEGIGPKIEGGGKYTVNSNYGTKFSYTTDEGSFTHQHTFVLFDVKIGDFWLRRADVDDIAGKMSIDSVPVVGVGSLWDAIDVVASGFTFNAQGGIERYGRDTLRSKWGEFPAEGIVARPVVPLFDRQGKRIITKIKHVDFK